MVHIYFDVEQTDFGLQQTDIGRYKSTGWYQNILWSYLFIISAVYDIIYDYYRSWIEEWICEKENKLMPWQAEGHPHDRTPAQKKKNSHISHE